MCGVLVLPRKWVLAGGNDALWGGDGTYSTVPYEMLPPVGTLDGSFDWLRDEDEAEGLGLDPENDVSLARLAECIDEAKALGLTVPAELVRFMEDGALHARLPSPTACYLQLGASLLPVPNHDGPERLLRFMNDQQCCYLWYVLLEPNERHRVVVAWPQFVGDADGGTLEEIATIEDASECASSFEELIKRMWIEGTLWFASSSGKPVAGELEAYAQVARSRATAS